MHHSELYYAWKFLPLTRNKESQEIQDFCPHKDPVCQFLLPVASASPAHCQSPSRHTWAQTVNPHFHLQSTQLCIWLKHMEITKKIV